jgi:photosystem II stability/assembly factor-like uncharacterized protein
MKRTQHALKNWMFILLISILTILGPGKSAQALWGTWNRVDLPIESDDWELNGVHFTSPYEGWAVGWDNTYSEGILLQCFFDEWDRYYLPMGSGPLYGVHFTSPYEGWAVGKGLYHCVYRRCEYVDPPYPSGTLRSVHFTSPNEGWAVGDWSLLHYVNGTWVRITLPELNYFWILYGVHFTSSNEGWAVGVYERFTGDIGILLHYLNGTWKSVELPDTIGILRSVYFTSPNEGWVVGDRVMLHYLNGTWTTTHNYSDKQYRGVHFVSPDQGFAVGSDRCQYSQGETTCGFIEGYDKGKWGSAGEITWPPSSEWGRHNWELRGVHATPESSSSIPVYQGWAVGVDMEKVLGHRSGILLNAEFIFGAANPDLTGQWKSLKQTCKIFPHTKCEINGSIIIQNVGNQKARSFTVDFYLSDDDQYEEGDIFLERVSTGRIKAGDSVVKKLRYRLPVGESASGRYIIAVIDPEDVVTELDEVNNEVAYGPIPSSGADLD